MEMTTIIRIAVMIVGAGFAIFGMNKAKAGANWGQPVAICGAIIAIIGALWGIKNTISGADQTAARDRELEYQRIQTRELGKYLATKFAGEKVLVMVDPMLYVNVYGEPVTRIDTALEGLKQGLDGKLPVVDTIYPKMPFKTRQAPVKGPDGVEMPAEDDMIEPMEVWFDSKKMNEILPAPESYDILVTLVGLPNGKPVPALAGKKLALVGGDTSTYGILFKAQDKRLPLTVASVTHNPKAVYDDKPIPRDAQEAFNKRFLLITAENIDQVMTDHPGLLQR